MKKSYFIPDFTLRKLTDFSPTEIVRLGYTWLILDVDNTLVPKGTSDISEAYEQWVHELKTLGVIILLCSNNFSQVSQQLAHRLQINYLKGAMKPFTFRIRKIVEEQIKEQKTLIMGDQIFTDVRLGKSLKFDTALINPLSSKDWISTRCLRWIEHFILERPQ